MNVYVLMHDDRYYDMGDSYIRGIYPDVDAALADLATREASGRLSRAYGAHTASCCSVDEWEVSTSPHPDIQEAPDLSKQAGGYLIPNALIDDLVAGFRR